MAESSKKMKNAPKEDISKELLRFYRNEKIHRVQPVKEVDFENRVMVSMMYQLRIEEKKNILRMRDRWSTIFLITILSILIFEIIVTILVGAGCLKYEDEWFIRIIITFGFADILAMPLIVTKFLFPVNGKDSSPSGSSQ